jgi:CRISPR-associated endonuclease/helicase Cas3
MPLSRGEFKAQGLDEMRRLLLADRGRETRADLSRRFDVDRATIGRWIVSLESMGYAVEEDEQRRLYIDRRRYFTHLSLSRDESVLLMIALRLLQQYLDKPNAHAVEMLHKLGLAFHQGLAPKVGGYVQDMADQQRLTLPAERPDPDRQRILELVSEAWIDSRKLQIRYSPFRGRRAFDDVVHPYMIEPSAIGRSTYLIGFSELACDIRVYKIERFAKRPLVLDERFDAPEHMDIRRLLNGAWGIWFNKDEQPTTVKLRFSSFVRKRVEESRWHPSERTEADDNGGLIWIAEIDEVKEMLPWIRGWGADCEVLEPQGLREKMIGEVRRQMRVYGIDDTDAGNRQQRFDDIFG